MALLRGGSYQQLQSYIDTVASELDLPVTGDAAVIPIISGLYADSKYTIPVTSVKFTAMGQPDSYRLWLTAAGVSGSVYATGSVLWGDEYYI